MPAAYMKMKKKFMQDGMDEKGSKSKAARIYNSKNPDAPVGPDYEASLNKNKFKSKTKSRSKKKRPVNFKRPGY